MVLRRVPFRWSYGAIQCHDLNLQHVFARIHLYICNRRFDLHFFFSKRKWSDGLMLTALKITLFKKSNWHVKWSDRRRLSILFSKNGRDCLIRFTVSIMPFSNVSGNWMNVAINWGLKKLHFNFLLFNLTLFNMVLKNHSKYMELLIMAFEWDFIIGRWSHCVILNMAFIAYNIANILLWLLSWGKSFDVVVFFSLTQFCWNYALFPSYQFHCFNFYNALNPI